MKYFLYISDAKVDMLFSQVPLATKEKVATEYKLDLKLFSAAHRTETQSLDDRVSRLQAVVEHILENEDVGTVDDPRSYISGRLSMQAQTSGGFLEDFLNDAILFYGETDKTVLLLGGSTSYLIGGTGLKSKKGAFSQSLFMSGMAEAFRGQVPQLRIRVGPRQVKTTI